MIVVDERAEGAPQVFRAEQDHLAQALPFHGLHPSLRQRVHIGRLEGSADNRKRPTRSRTPG